MKQINTLTTTITFAIAFLIALGTFVTAPALAGETVWQRLPNTIDDFDAYARERRAARGELAARSGDQGAFAARNTVATGRVLLPSYEVNTMSAAGLTTLFAVRNLSPDTEAVTIRYFDKAFLQLAVVEVMMATEQIVTFNLRDIPEVIAAAEPDGFARGSVLVDSVDGDAVLTGDYFIVDPGNDFATGGNLVTLEDACRNWSVRFLNGGAFTGGTKYRTLINQPRGTDPDAGPTVLVTIRDESGTALGTVGASTSDLTFNFTAADVLAGAGLSTTSGSLDVFFDELSEIGGILGAEFSATGRFSVGVDAVCEDVPPEP